VNIDLSLRWTLFLSRVTVMCVKILNLAHNVFDLLVALNIMHHLYDVMYSA